MSDHCDFTQRLTEQGLRVTPVRLALLEILAESPRALRAQEIIEAVRTRRRVNKVTVYRILEDFSRRGIVRRLFVDARLCHYELACEQHHPIHPHFHCHSCHEVQCLEPVPLAPIWSELKGPLGNQADNIDIRVGGLCHKCREKG